MGLVKKTLRALHWLVVAYLVVLAAPAVATNFIRELSPLMARFLHRLTPWPGRLLWPWLFCLAYLLACLFWSAAWREKLLSRLGGMRRPVLIALGFSLAVLLAGLVQINCFSVKRYPGLIPPIGRLERQAWLEKHPPVEEHLMIWPGLGIPSLKLKHRFFDVEDSYQTGELLYYYNRTMAVRNLAQIMLAVLVLEIAALCLYARRLGTQP